MELLAVGLRLALEGVREADLVQRAPGEQEPDAVARRVVLQPDLGARISDLEQFQIRNSGDLISYL